MAVRNPIAYHNWLDEDALASGKPILAETPDYILNDQVFALDQQALIMSVGGTQIFEPIGAGWVTLSTFHVKNKDMCDVASVTNDEILCDFYALGNAGATATGEARLTSTATASNTAVCAFPGGGAGWVKSASSFNVKTNDIEDTITLELRKVSGAGIIYIYSLAIVALQT